MKNDNFNKVYNDILNEDNKKFTYQFGEDLPEEYLTDIPQIKQCKFTRHFLIELRDEEEKWKCKITKEVLYKNIQKFLQKLFENKNLVNKIDKNEYKRVSFECIFSTTEKFNNNKNFHAIIPVDINSKYIKNGIIEYYFLFDTFYLKDSESYEEFKKQNYRSKERPNQEPVLILGESVEDNK